MSLTATFDAAVSRVRLAATVLTGASTALFERSKNGLLWTTVRGGTAVTVTSGDAALDDYEFDPGVINYYRVTGTPGSVTFSTTITPSQSDVWIKSLTRPFLNRAVIVSGHGDIVRPSRSGVFEIIGRSLPVALTDVQGSPRWDLTLKTETLADADALELVFASGDPLYIQVPATGKLSTVPGGYVLAGDVRRSRFGTDSPRRWFDMTLTAVAPPGADVYGVPATWDTITAEFGSWTAVLSEFATWQELADYVSSPSVVIVP